MSLLDKRRRANVDADFVEFARERYFAEKNSPNPDPAKLADLADRLHKAESRADMSYDEAHRFDDER